MDMQTHSSPGVIILGIEDGILLHYIYGLPCRASHARGGGANMKYNERNKITSSLWKSSRNRQLWFWRFASRLCRLWRSRDQGNLPGYPVASGQAEANSPQRK